MKVPNAALLDAVIERDGCLCHYCGAPLVRAGGLDPNHADWANMMATLDHRTPLSRGGSDRLGNLVAACLMCNCRKGTRPYLDYVFQLDWEARQAAA